MLNRAEFTGWNRLCTVSLPPCCRRHTVAETYSVYHTQAHHSHDEIIQYTQPLFFLPQSTLSHLTKYVIHVPNFFRHLLLLLVNKTYSFLNLKNNNSFPNFKTPRRCYKNVNYISLSSCCCLVPTCVWNLMVTHGVPFAPSHHSSQSHFLLLLTRFLTLSSIWPSSQLSTKFNGCYCSRASGSSPRVSSREICQQEDMRDSNKLVWNFEGYIRTSAFPLCRHNLL